MPDALISIVIPCRNEAANLPLLIDEIEAAMAGRDFELIIVNDGSTDETAAVLTEQAALRSFPVRELRHQKSAGQSLSVRSGAWAARGGIVATIDGDGQNDPQYIPVLVDALRQAGPDFGAAQGQRLKRRDSKVKQLASRFANWLRNAILHDETRDTGCGLKAVHTDILRKLPFFDGTHRFVPALVIQEGYRVVHCDVVDRSRRHGKSNYGIFDRGLQGALDLGGVWWLRRRRRRMPKVEEIKRV
ncbi:dolichol-phosphate mannosyltransferase [Mesorhizobium sp. SEMIA 3007]|uniref:Glycosyltransferase family 2 protein n=1 Tax=Mesorhizobium jarvisii TaxID=1777867 RepID=A0A6M7TK72_9HYPH|nr:MULTISPECIES: glycosyltransferase family 2 protein [Mesorhizobium]OBQ68449.1 dolichol-phosphate mannosyltransferase [Mesorhizobium loti]ODA94789.1 dolichol-phosphate mannosyltransferase [Mesorhizobium sp. SEMIA 3007]QKC65132.1 glycosyltransferase family 2 protein [Mesorhizobium jarvisii]QKD11046.1 glycosyltransferase family 2 protein [Mesorhizobium loti]RJT31148.1 glycosyltransferase family 2 protein [Mesorhizobium jarvisii]